jgi:putative redox protein
LWPAKTFAKELTMNHEIETQWMGKMQFNALINGHTVVMDAPERVGGDNNGPIPKPLVLTALSGCTGMDIVALLRKGGHSMQGLNIKVAGELSKSAPITYTAIHIVYEFEGPEESLQAAMDAVTKSQEEYCGVSRMLKQVMPVTWDVWYNGKEIFKHQVALASDQALAV